MLAHLPLELVLEIIEGIVAGSDGRTVAYPPRGWRTKLLLSFCTAGKATHEHARRLLYQHCVYVDSPTSLRLLLRTLSGPEDDRDVEDAEDIYMAEREGRHHATRDLIHSMYLSPFPGPGIDDLPVAQWMAQLLLMLRNRLRRLVVEIDINSLEPEQDHLDVLPTLWRGIYFQEALEEYFSVVDEKDARPRLRTRRLEPAPVSHLLMWRMWPNIKRLCLHWEFTLAMLGWTQDGNPMPRHLTHLVLVMQGHPSLIDPLLRLVTSQPLRVVLLYSPTGTDDRAVLPRLEPLERQGAVNEFPIDVVGAAPPDRCLHTWDASQRNYTTVAVENWIRDEALAGTLWSLGTVVLGTRRSRL